VYLCVCVLFLFILSSEPMRSCFACSLSLLCRTAGMLQYWPERRVFVSKCVVMNLSPACAVAVLYLRLIPTSSGDQQRLHLPRMYDLKSWTWDRDLSWIRNPKHKAVNFEHRTSQSLYTSGDISIRVWKIKYLHNHLSWTRGRHLGFWKKIPKPDL
jgi:hypothetical protein